MGKGSANKIRRYLLCTLLVALTPACGARAWADAYTIDEIAAAYELEMMFMNSGPEAPAGFEPQTADIAPQSQTAQMLSGVPTSSWTYGCSATSAGMMFGYFDRLPNGWYANMYTGPANGGVAPLTNLGGQCSIIATKNGFDGRSTRGHVDDYWIATYAAGPDPWEGNWTEHTWGDCTADYMGTNQWKWDYDLDTNRDSNIDGGTTLWSYDGPAKLYDHIPLAAYGLPQTALSHGMRLFAESRGYAVSENYTQKIDALYAGGFSFNDYMAEINAGYPVMISVTGHSMVGVGYDSATQKVYLHDTWGDYVAEMTWGGSYGGRQHEAMTVIHFEQGIPEPGTVTLFVLGLLALRARKRKSS